LIEQLFHGVLALLADEGIRILVFGQKRRAAEQTGFDENLKIEFNDIDLCLGAGERGWSTIWTPESTLIHLHSATRGTPMRPSKLFYDDHEYFRKRWIHRIRDDRYFHPALSLFSHKPALA
jgi:GT2 family glycosyltransferase